MWYKWQIPLTTKLEFGTGFSQANTLTQRNMRIKIKSAEEFQKMRVAGRLAASVLEMIGPHVKAGTTTGELDKLCHDFIVSHNAVPAALGYQGSGSHPPFPKSVCTSVNHQVCHGIPGDRQLKEGDILNIDVAVIKDGYYGDTSKMFFAGKPSVLAKKLVEVTYECMMIGARMVKPGVQLGDIGYAIQQHAEKNRFSVVRDFCGHGIGNEFHEDPQVLHYGKPKTGPIIKAGMAFTIEPMVNAGKYPVKILPDGWTVVTKDHSLSAQWEHTILVTETGHEIATLRQDEAGFIEQRSS